MPNRPYAVAKFQPVEVPAGNLKVTITRPRAVALASPAERLGPHLIEILDQESNVHDHVKGTRSSEMPLAKPADELCRSSQDSATVVVQRIGMEAGFDGGPLSAIDTPAVLIQQLANGLARSQQAAVGGEWLANP